MAKKKEEHKELEALAVVEPFPPLAPEPITPLNLDYPSESLNDMARTINKLIERENER